jgi:hypothetical protein
MLAVTAPQGAFTMNDGWSVWAVNDGEKINRDSVNHPAKNGNSSWDGKTVGLFGARNETVAVQVMVSAGSAPVTVESVSVKFDAPGLEPEIFSEHYIEIKTPTPDDEHAGWFWYKAAAPNMTGWIPDALVPVPTTTTAVGGAKPGRGGLPLKIAKGNLQGFWVDIAIPRNGVPAGIHTGKLIVKTNAGAKELPVRLEILDATLPDSDSVKTMIYLSDIERRHGRKDPALKHAYRLMAHRHRLDVVESLDYGDLAGYKQYLTGEAFTPAHGYRGPAEGLGLKVFGIGFYGAVSDKETREELWAKFDQYALWFRDNAPDVLAFIYLTDEPRKDRMPWVAEKSGWIHANPGPGGKIPVLVTTRPQPELEGAIDIYATVADNVYLDQLPVEKKKGRRWWFYNGMRPMSGAITTDTWGVDPRVQPWICRLYGVDLWFYWETTQWQHNFQGPRAHMDQNVWADPITFAGGDAMVNGDGVLYYPGEDVFFPDQDRGIKGPISSIRMKNLRRGQQDVAYFDLAVAAGREKEARVIGKKLIPRAFSDAKPDQDASWPSDGSAWDSARRELGALIVR